MGKLVLAAIAAVVLLGGAGGAQAGDSGRELLTQRSKGGRATFVSSAGCVTTTVTVTLDDTATERAAQGAPGAKERLRDAVITVEQLFDPALGEGCARPDPIIQD